jgi:lysophospholipase L1-like esterase
MQDPAGPRFGWSSSGFVARFLGTRLDVRLRDTAGLNLFQVFVDGQPTLPLATRANQERYTLVAGLAEGEHEVMLVKRTEGRVGEVQLLGFVTTEGGAMLAPLPGPSRRIELIGDSITAGYGNEGADEHCRFSPTTENETTTYGALTSRALGAEHSTVAWSGKTIEGVAQIYDRALPTRADSRWDSSAWVPDAVVINLGTNDLTIGDRRDTFVQSYLKLLDRVRALYPKALIVCAVGPMLTDTYPPGKQTLSHARAYVGAAVHAKKQAGDEHVVYLEFPTQDIGNGYGCDYHPSKKTHELMAERLTTLLRTELKW